MTPRRSGSVAGLWPLVALPVSATELFDLPLWVHLPVTFVLVCCAGVCAQRIVGRRVQDASDTRFLGFALMASLLAFVPSVLGSLLHLSPLVTVVILDALVLAGGTLTPRRGESATTAAGFAVLVGLAAVVLSLPLVAAATLGIEAPSDPYSALTVEDPPTPAADGRLTLRVRYTHPGSRATERAEPVAELDGSPLAPSSVEITDDSSVFTYSIPESPRSCRQRFSVQVSSRRSDDAAAPPRVSVWIGEGTTPCGASRSPSPSSTVSSAR